MLGHLATPTVPAPLDWSKGRAATDRVIYEIATAPRLIALLRPLLGEDIILWGAITTRRKPGTQHAWHTDVESAAAESRAVSVWVGLCNTGRESGLQFVAGSHRFGRSIQEAAASLNLNRATMTDAEVAEMAQGFDPSARILEPDVSDGEALLFDGRIWHGARNTGTRGVRMALLLQYARADMPILMPVKSGYEWPFRYTTSPRVPAIPVSGSVRRTVNRLVPPPPQQTQGMPMITTLARSVALPLAEDSVKRWRVYPQFRGPTRTFANMSCHISVLSDGHQPHPPHVHKEEELLIVLDGEVDIVLADDPGGGGSHQRRLKPGMFSYYPATQHHTIRNTGPKPATYLMFKWHAGLAGVGEPLPASVFEYDVGGAQEGARPMSQKLLFQQATHCLGKLHAHQTTLQPGAGYDPHADAYDVAILLLSGEVETLGERLTPLGIVYYSAGELHGMRNVGSVPAVYLVFEFHSPAVVAAKAQKMLGRAEHQTRKSEKRRRKRGVAGLIRKLGKLVRRLTR